MKRLLFCICVFFSAASHGTELRPFVGAGGQFQLMMLYHNSDPRDYSDIYPALQPYVEAGVEFRNWEIYGTHEYVEPWPDEWHSGTAIDTVTLTSRSSYRKEWWTSERFCLGVRYRGERTHVRPLAGVGIELGRYVKSYRNTEYRNYYELIENEWGWYYNIFESQLLRLDRESKRSTLNLGGVVEFGVGYSPSADLELICVTRVHGAMANLRHGELGIYFGDYWIVSPAFLLQIRIVPITFRI